MSEPHVTEASSSSPTSRRPWLLALGGLIVAGAVLERLDGALGTMHGEQDAAGGFGQVASPSTLFRSDEAMDVVRGWANWDAIKPPDAVSSIDVTHAYLLFDLILIAAITYILVLARRGVEEARKTAPADSARDALISSVTWQIVTYAGADVLETGLTAYASTAVQPSLVFFLIGFSSLVKWIALGLVAASLVVALWGRIHATLSAPWANGEFGRTVVALRAQLVVMAAVVAILLALSGDLGRQVDDVVVRAGASLPVMMGTVLAVAGFSVTLFFGCRSTLRAYQDTPTPEIGTSEVGVSEPETSEGSSTRPYRAKLYVGVVTFGAGVYLMVFKPLPGWWDSSIAAPLVAVGGLLLLFSLLNAPRALRAHTANELKLTTVPGAGNWVLQGLLAAGPAALLIAVLRATTTGWLDGGTSSGVFGQLLLWIVAVIVAWLVPFMVSRWAEPKDSTAKSSTSKHDSFHRVLRWSAAALVFGAIGAVGLPDVAGGLGSVTVIYIGMTFLVVAATALVLVGDAWAARGVLAVAGFRRVPVLSMVLVLGLAASFIDRDAVYYDARLMESQSGDLRPLVAGSDGEAGVLQEWLQQQDPDVDSATAPAEGAGPVASATRRNIPLVLVAASGGGIRAAYWTTLVWDCLFGHAADVEGETCDHPVDSDNVLMVSSVSGSSVGMAMTRASETEKPSDSDWRTRAFEADYVAPAVAAAIFRDLPNSILRAPIPGADRASTLEIAFERQNPGMADGFSATARTGGKPRFPLLLLNGTSVEDGCRVAVSVVSLEPSSDRSSDCLTASLFTATNDGRRPDGVLSASKDALLSTCVHGDGNAARDIALSTAALLSARFPYVSPSGGLSSCTDQARTFVLDGGLLNNSGADSLTEVWAAIEPSVRTENETNTEVCIVPRLLLLDNSFASFGPRSPTSRSLQIVAPGTGLGRVQASADVAAQQRATIALARSLDTTARACGEKGGESIAQIFPRARPGTQAPLGWALSTRSQEVMRAELIRDSNAAQIRRVIDWYEQ